VPSFSTCGPTKPSSPPESTTTTTILSPSSGLGEPPPQPGPRIATAPSPYSNNVPHDAAILLTPDSATHPGHPAGPSSSSAVPPLAALPRISQQSTPWPSSIPEMGPGNIIRPKPTYFHPREQAPMQEPSPVIPFSNVHFQAEELLRENFAVWLFDPQTQYGDLGVAQGLPFMEGGLESAFNSNIHYDYESLTSSRSQLETPPRLPEASDDALTEFRRQDVLRWFQSFRLKQPKSGPLIANLIHESGGDLPALNVQMMRDCLQEYWDHVSPRLPIIHQPTFSCNRCSIFLLMVMIALGAASLRCRDLTGNLSDYGAFADVIITTVRWEIMTADEASPPVSLWVAQALLLVEFYEKMYSSRPLHERAHIYHSVVLTLLRRGSPLIGRGGSESPPEEATDNSSSHVTATLDPRTWWMRWAETEAMHRVVFAAFMLDITHAAMFGHASDMAPHEIRLPLPCDDNLWAASSPDIVRQLDQNFRMYGFKTQVSFLDGLKRALHGQEVRTHSFGRMIILSGLLSVGWHLRHRQTDQRWLELVTPSIEKQESSRKVLLKAFDDWKFSFDAAQGHGANSPSAVDAGGGGAGGPRASSLSNGPIQSAAVLYHLAHITLHVDIIDCQVYAGAKRLLGRKVSTRDYANVVARMPMWASQRSTRHAVLHAFKLLHRVLVEPRQFAHNERKAQRQGPGGGMNGHVLPPIEAQTYSCRSESDPHRPWIMYYAALSIWSFVRAVNSSGRHDPLSDVTNAQMLPAPRSLKPVHVDYRRVVAYLSRVANLAELTEQVAGSLADGLPDLLDTLHAILTESHSELLKEAHERLRVCKELLVGSGV
jgi:hypothetical protein